LCRSGFRRRTLAPRFTKWIEVLQILDLLMSIDEDTSRNVSEQNWSKIVPIERYSSYPWYHRFHSHRSTFFLSVENLNSRLPKGGKGFTTSHQTFDSPLRPSLMPGELYQKRSPIFNSLIHGTSMQSRHCLFEDTQLFFPPVVSL
jgi:hypothetical protein